MGTTGAVEFADGQYGQPLVRRDLPPHLSAEEHRGRRTPCACRPLLEVIRVTRQSPVRVRGVRSECLYDLHALEHWLSGVWQGRDLVLWVCSFCWQVQVHDVSQRVLIDEASDGRRLRLTPLGMERRMDDVLGRYTGARPLGRTYG